MNTLTHIDLFSGGGGFALACQWNGIETEVFCEKDDRCRGFLQRTYPEVPISNDAEELLKLCEEFVHIVKNERFLQVTPDVSRVIQKLLESGEIKTGNFIEKSKGNTTEGGNKKYATTMEENVSVVGRIGWSSFVSITNAIMEERNAKSTTIHPSGKSQSSEDCQMISNSFATTATMQNRCTEYVHIKRPWILTAGVPCQPASRAGKQRGKEDNRWLWPTAVSLIRYFNPTWCLLENPPGIGDVGLDGILADLENQAYEVRVFGIPACAVNSPQLRNRYWIVANSRSARSEWGAAQAEQARRASETQVSAQGHLAHSTGRQDNGRGDGDLEEAKGCGGSGYTADRVTGQSDMADGGSQRRQQDTGSAPENEGEYARRPKTSDNEPTGDVQSDMADTEATTGIGLQNGEEPEPLAQNGRCNPDFWRNSVWLPCADGKLRRAPDDSFGVAHGLHRSVLAALGNSIVPQVAYEIIKAIVEVENVPKA